MMNRIKSMLGYAIVEEFRKGNIDAKKTVAETVLNTIDSSEQFATLIKLDEFLKEHTKENHLAETFDLMLKLLEQDKVDKESLDILKDTIRFLLDELPKALTEN